MSDRNACGVSRVAACSALFDESLRAQLYEILGGVANMNYAPEDLTAPICEFSDDRDA